MGFCAYNAVPATMNGWLRSVVSGAVFVQAVRGARRMAESAALLVDEV
jgi:hypothetical protein